LTIVNGLLDEGATISIYDPKVEPCTIKRDVERVSGIRICGSVLEAARGAHALVVCTEWDEFKAVDYERVYGVMEKPAHVFDGRLILDLERLRKIGFVAHSIGRADRH
jgi:UDPglucose 6-dehydrogenase